MLSVLVGAGVGCDHFPSFEVTVELPEVIEPDRELNVVVGFDCDGAERYALVARSCAEDRELEPALLLRPSCSSLSLVAFVAPDDLEGVTAETRCGAAWTTLTGETLEEGDDVVRPEGAPFGRVLIEAPPNQPSSPPTPVTISIPGL